MSRGVGFRHGSDPALLWLWHRLAAIAPIRPLAWETPYATVVAQEIAKNKQTKKRLKKMYVICKHIGANIDAIKIDIKVCYTLKILYLKIHFFQLKKNSKTR